MLKLHRIFFYNFLTIFVAAFLVQTLVSYFFLKEVEITQSKEQLKNVLNITALKLENSKDFDKDVHKISQLTQMRITLIAKDGTVVGESNKDKNKMDNHLARIEVKQANVQEFGSAIRYSNTLRRDFLYAAQKVTIQEQIYYLRVALPLKRLMGNFYANWVQLSILFALLIIVAFFSSYQISKRIDVDVRALTQYLKQIAQKNYKAPLVARFSVEFVQITTVLKNMVAKLERREKQKRKYTARLRLINKQRNDMLSAIGHELKNPLAAIQGYAQTLLTERLEPQNQDVYTRFLSKIINNSEKITTMIDRMALSVKLENNDLTPKFSQVSIRTLVLDAVHTVQKSYPNREIAIDVKDTIVEVDKTMMEMVCINLLDNALKYSQDDVKIGYKKGRLFVLDHGIGIEPEEIEKITGKFYRIDKNSWDNSMGLGLAIVSYILNMHNSALDISSELNQGTKFSFELKEFK